MRGIAVVLVLGIVAAGCGGEDEPGTGATAAAPPAPPGGDVSYAACLDVISRAARIA